MYIIENFISTIFYQTELPTSVFRCITSKDETKDATVRVEITNILGGAARNSSDVVYYVVCSPDGFCLLFIMASNIN